MSVTRRPIDADEFEAFARADAVAFGFTMTASDREAEKTALEFDRTLAAFDGAAVVGTTATLTLDLTLPGGAVLPAGGLTWTSVLPTHRRRGVLTGLIRGQLDLSREREEPLSILQASEATIYGRFGYGAATHELGFALASDASQFRPEVGGLLGGDLQVVDGAQAKAILSDTFDRLRGDIPGSVGRSERLWNSYLLDPDHHRDGASSMFHVTHRDPQGVIDGYVSYRVKADWSGGIPGGSLIMKELIASGPAAHAALWRYCLDMDLIAHVEAECAPEDEPLRWLLASPRHMRFRHLNDGLWLRILDIPTALSHRSYALTTPGTAPDALVLEVDDPFYGRVGDRYLLEAGPEGATCSFTARSADLSLDVAELGALYLGAVDFGALVRARRVRELTPGAAARADVLFRTDRAPWCSTHF
jgi:predicted acetyltransferase